MIGLLSAPSNLGLRPPQRGSVPGTAKAPEALREAGLHGWFQERGATDLGTVLAGRYVDDDDSRDPALVRNQAAILDHTDRLAARVDDALDAGVVPLVLGGDCSVLIGPALALRRRGRHGLVHLDGHTDFRHPGNSSWCANLAGEDLAAVVGLHRPAISDIAGLSPYVAGGDVAHLGCRADDENLAEVRAAIGAVVTADELTHDVEDGGAAVDRAVAVAGGGGGRAYWLHLDVDVLDPDHLPAVDSPTPGGLAPDVLVDVLRALAPGACGASVTIFDPDQDPDGGLATRLVGILTAGLAELGRDR